MNLRSNDVVLQDIKQLVKTKGFIYALCMMIFEDFNVVVEELHLIDHYKRLSTNEASMLIGFLIQNKIDFSIPEKPIVLIDLKKRCYELIKELQDSFNIPFIEKLSKIKEEGNLQGNPDLAQKIFLGTGDMLIEPIFYSGCGVYDFQYFDFFEKKYKYDKQWLLVNKNFDFENLKMIVEHIRNIINTKSQKVHLKKIEELKDKFSKIGKTAYSKTRNKKKAQHLLEVAEFHQYVELFFDDTENKEFDNDDERREAGWNSFYKGLIELFTFSKSDFDENINLEVLIENFSLQISDNLNSNFQNIGHYNIFNSKPIIELDRDKYFIPILYLLYVAIYENPYYWMFDDKTYLNISSKNRGLVGEEIAFDFLSTVFGKDCSYKSVKIINSKNDNVTDIDVLCVLGTKALCVQVKSKKLTMLSKSGDTNQIIKDFKGAIQDAYEQGIISRRAILDRNAKYYNESGLEIKLSEEIDEVYIVGITTENYPALTFQSRILLDKKDNNPNAIFMSIFDLELVTHYLKEPYNFLYYIRQRIIFNDYFLANEEIIYLGYHLIHKLSKIPDCDIMVLDTEWGQLIDRNYFPYKSGIKVSDEGDKIKSKWQNDDFELILYNLKSINQPKITDIIFTLFEYSSEAREGIVDKIISTKKQTILDGKTHNFTLLPDGNYSPRIGLTIVSMDSTLIELKENLVMLCEVRKYKSRGDIWLGFGCIKNSPKIFDYVVFNNHYWEFDDNLYQMTNEYFKDKKPPKFINNGKNIGRNDKCLCGSELKFKRCCGTVRKFNIS